MSKVHEALKRAQEERSLAANSVQDQDRTTGPVGVVAPAVESRPPDSAFGRDPRTGQFLRFEDLLRSCSKPAWVLDLRTVVFCGSNPQACGTEQFRTLRTRLYDLRENSPLKKILITSAVPREGKTFIATNLSQAIALERDRRILLIDADLRNPSLHLPLGAPLSPGLSDYLRDQANDAEIIQHGQEGNLWFIPAGNPGSDPSELLSNGAFEKLINRVAPLFDWVIVDSPPCLPVADANVIAGLCDGVLLVVRAKSTPSVAADRARKELQKRKIIGVVLNAAEEGDSYGAYSYGNTHSPKKR
jgi:capsular exopolysaccharide synthesis family protein